MGILKRLNDGSRSIQFNAFFAVNRLLRRDDGIHLHRKKPRYENRGFNYCLLLKRFEGADFVG